MRNGGTSHPIRTLLRLAEVVRIGIGTCRGAYEKGEAVASPLFGAVKLLVNSQPAISEGFI